MSGFSAEKQIAVFLERLEIQPDITRVKFFHEDDGRWGFVISGKHGITAGSGCVNLYQAMIELFCHIEEHDRRKKNEIKKKSFN